MHEEVIIAGFGGQGIMVIGQLLTQAGMMEGKNVVWFPSYGPEMRGGTANCTVIISSEQIGSPISANPHSIIVLNRPSLERFEKIVRPGGNIIVNSSLIRIESTRAEDCHVVKVPGNEIAAELGNLRVTNMVMLGSYIAQAETVALESALDALKEVLPERHHNLIPINQDALKRGAEYHS
jgi:2-oxoglutarate ferredoxin oxidoreductase subunit gamma